MDLRSKQRAVIEFLYHEGIKQSEIAVRLKKVYKEHAFNQSTVSRWLARFKSSTFVEENDEENVTTLKTLADETHSFCPLSVMTTDKIMIMGMTQTCIQTQTQLIPGTQLL